MKKFFVPFEKFEESDDGTIVVCGIASSESIDSDGEVIKSEAMLAALPDFFKYGTGNLREMHQPLAAGTVNDAKVENGNTYIQASVVDPVAIAKVRAGVYKGFSIGGRVTEKNGSTITGIKLSEISLVDRPANPDATFQMWKMEDGLEVSGSDSDVETFAKLLNDNSLSMSDAIKSVNATLRKGMYDVSWLAQLLDELSSIQQSAEWSADESSAVPQMLKDAVSQLCKVLQAMVNEETLEIAAAEMPKDLSKAFIDAGMKDGELHSEFISSLVKSRDEALAQIEEWKNKPAPAKAILKAVSKGQDLTTEENEPIDDSPKDSVQLIKMARQQSGFRIF